jgi:hypothetical protein
LTKFTPANYAFAIWSIIYTLVIGFAIYQALPSQRDNPKLTGVRELFAVFAIKVRYANETPSSSPTTHVSSSSLLQLFWGGSALSKKHLLTADQNPQIVTMSYV